MTVDNACQCSEYSVFAEALRRHRVVVDIDAPSGICFRAFCAETVFLERFLKVLDFAARCSMVLAFGLEFFF